MNCSSLIQQFDRTNRTIQFMNNSAAPIIWMYTYRFPNGEEFRSKTYHTILPNSSSDFTIPQDSYDQRIVYWIQPDVPSMEPYIIDIRYPDIYRSSEGRKRVSRQRAPHDAQEQELRRLLTEYNKVQNMISDLTAQDILLRDEITYLQNLTTPDRNQIRELIRRRTDIKRTLLNLDRQAKWLDQLFSNVTWDPALLEELGLTYT